MRDLKIAEGKGRSNLLIGDPHCMESLALAATSPFWLGKARARSERTLRKSSGLNLPRTDLIKYSRGVTEGILRDGSTSPRQVELQQEERRAVSSHRVCRRLLPHHEFHPVPLACQHDGKPPLSLATEPFPAYGKAHLYHFICGQ